MDTNKETRRDEQSEDERSNENWQYTGNMGCPYMNACPMMYEMMYSGVNDTRDEDDDEDDVRSPRPGGYYHGYGHHYYPYPYYPYYPSYGYPAYGYPTYGYPLYGYPYNRPRPW